MDAAFIQQNQIIERYLMGRLPPKGAQDFERFCREHPEIVTQLGLAEHINAALRLLDASGQPEPWAEKPRPRWQHPGLLGGVAAALAVLLLGAIAVATMEHGRNTVLAARNRELLQQPLPALQGTRAFAITPARDAPPASSAAVIHGAAELADLRFDLSWSSYANFRVTIDHVNQGRFAVLEDVARDSSGQLRIGLNSSALGPGEYAVTIEGIDRWGKPVPQAWARFGVAR
ncbi:MAG TPA: hypothetical protein VMH77_00675 [Steroidobacteraceae bacterium]|nr:hypothetical protein [Steroidobacteraceae bacterium]